MKKSKNAIILCSGGLDSVVTAYYIKKRLNYQNILILFFNYDQRALIQERKNAKKCAGNLNGQFHEIRLDMKATPLVNKTIKFKEMTRNQLKNTQKESDKFYVPFRNMVFITHALNFIDSLKNSEEVYNLFLGFKSEGKESYPDTTKEFVSKMNNLLKIYKYRGKILAPLINKDKDEIISLGEKLGVSFKDTYSCHKGAKKHCGTCLACALRKEAFYWANVSDPTQYPQKSLT